MIELIAIEFIKNQGGTTPRKMAETTLKIIEEAGMLPPCIKINPSGYITTKWEEENS